MDPVPHLSRSVAGKVVLVTGAASGMGRATAHVFAREGAKVAVTDRDEAGAQGVAEAIKGEGGEAFALALDVADEAAIQAVVAGVVERFGGLDIVINNAGVPGGLPVDDARYDEVWGRQFDISWCGPTRG